MQQIVVILDDQEFAQVVTRAQEAGVSVEAWVHDLVRQATAPMQPIDPLFGLLAGEPELADALDAVVSERGTRALRRP